MAHSTRRDFLATTSLTTLGLALGHRPRTVLALSPQVLSTTDSADTILPTPFAETDLRALAESAVDTAKQAGATYADIRVAESRRLLVGVPRWAINEPSVELESRFEYGVRAMVDGAIAFVHGTVPNSDGITAAARQAVAAAQSYAALGLGKAEWIPSPVVTGTWTTPIQIDPFTVPLRAQVDLIHAMEAAAERTFGGRAQTHFEWMRETRVFASTEGSLVTQALCRARPFTLPGAKATLWPDADVQLDHFGPVSGGYEIVLVPNLQERMKAAAEEAARLSALPVGTFDLGRVPVVMSGLTVGTVFGQTVGQALQLDRVLGAELDAAGGSFLAPAHEILGAMTLNPLLTVTGHRTLPSVHAVQWDDEGIVPEPFPLIHQGRVIDYCTSRATAGALASWYQGQGIAIRSHGCAVAERASDPVQVSTPHLTIAPNPHGSTLEDLCHDMVRGLLITQADAVSTDRQFATGLIPYGQMFEIARGKIIRRIQHAGVQFQTRTLWKNLTMFGDATTVRDAHYRTWKGNPWRGAEQTVTAPAGLFKDVDIISTARRGG